MRLAALIFGLALILPLLVLGGIYLWSPASSLDALDSLFPGHGPVRRVASEMPFAAGPRGRLDVWAEPGGAREPVVVFFYGGGWRSGRRQDYGFVAKAYAARGFVVVIPDYRLVPDVRFPAFIDDAARAVRWTHDNVARFGGDPDRIVLAGHSAGAYLAVMLALDRRYLEAAGVNPNIVRAAAGFGGPYDFHPFDETLSIDAMGQAPDWRATQPILFARADAPPLMLVMAGKDNQVRAHNAINLAARQKVLGSTTTELVEYPGLEHNDLVVALSRPFRSKAPLLDDSVAFFKRSLK
jgi:acetyl esterase/lipase